MTKFKNKLVSAQVLKIVYGKLEDEINALAGVIPINSWEDVQKAVRSGIASKVFSIGDQLTCQKDGVNLVWDIIGIDHDTPADPQYTHSMTLQLHDCFQTSLQYDAPEAFYYAENGLAAGTYHFAIDSSYDASHQSFNNYQFTLTQDVPAGGQLGLEWSYNAASSTILVKSYASPSAVAQTESVSVTEGTDGTDLGVLTVSGDLENNLNSIPRARFGSNTYKGSSVRQWLNSVAAADSVWSPQTDYDRPPEWAANTAGFMNGMDADFLAVIGNTKISVAKNTVIDGGGYDSLDDKFFLLSRSEVYGGLENSIDEGEPYSFYSQYSDLSTAGETADSNRIKLKSGTAQTWWLRTPDSNSSYFFRVVKGANGAIDMNSATSTSGIAPACNII